MVDFSIDIRGQGRPRQVEAAALATRQGGVISYWQLLELGFSRGAIQHWVASGRLYCVFRGVYALGHEVITPKGRLMAAVLACGPAAALSHRSASDWWGYWRTARSLVDVTVPGRSRKGQRGIDLHLVRSLDPRDVTIHEGIPITTEARTLLDLAEVLQPRQLKRAVEELDRQRRFDLAAVHDVVARSPGRHGLKPLLALLSEFRYDPYSREQFEADFFDFCIEYGLRTPTMNSIVEGELVDAYWPGTNVIVELDGWEFHRHRAAFERDREKGAELVAAGYRVMRITRRQLHNQPEAVAARLRKALATP